MPAKTIHIRPTPIEGPRPRVVPLHNGSLLPAEGKRCVEDAHVRMLLKHGDVEAFDPKTGAVIAKAPAPAPEPAEEQATSTAPEAQPTKSQRRVRGEEQSE